jgi:hypothetical protein
MLNMLAITFTVMFSMVTADFFKVDSVFIVSVL